MLGLELRVEAGRLRVVDLATGERLLTPAEVYAARRAEATASRVAMFQSCRRYGLEFRSLNTTPGSPTTVARYRESGEKVTAFAGPPNGIMNSFRFDPAASQSRRV